MRDTPFDDDLTSTAKRPLFPRPTNPVPPPPIVVDAIPTTKLPEIDSVDDMNATRPRKVVDAPGAPTLTLPIIPPQKDRKKMSETTMVPGHSRFRNKALDSHDITLVPGTLTAAEIHDRIHPVRPKSRVGMHRTVLAGLSVVLLATMLAVIPLGQGGKSGLSSWVAYAGGALIPPTPTPTQPAYATHPVANGAQSFICVALPFARLAQYRMREVGMSNPWYVSLMLAQWGIEHGWAIPGFTGYNWGNVSGIPGYPTVGGTAAWGSPSSFAYGNTPQQGVEEYVIFVQKQWYTGVAAAWPQGPYAQATALGQSPWDASHYGGRDYGTPGILLTNAIKNYGLQKYDDPNTTC